MSLNKKAVLADLLSPSVFQGGSLLTAVGQTILCVGLVMLLCEAAGGEVLALGRGASTGGNACSWEWFPHHSQPRLQCRMLARPKAGFDLLCFLSEGLE